MSRPRITLTDTDTKQTFSVPAEAVGEVRSRTNDTAAVATIAGRNLLVDQTRAAIDAELRSLWDQQRARGAVQEIVSKAAAYTATVSDHTILGDATGGAFSVTLPPAADVAGRIFCVKKIDGSGNAVTVDGDGAETIDGAATKALTAQWQTLVLQSDGAAWYILAGGASA